MSEAKEFLAHKAASNDVVLLEVLAVPAPQQLNARLLDIYAARKGLEGLARGAQISFVQAGSSWGNVSMVPGERAIVFLRSISGQLYEDAARGHLLIEDIDGQPFAIYKHQELWLSEEVPATLRAAARQDPKRPQASAIAFAVMERYLRALIAAQP